MTPSEFKAWFQGFTEALEGTPSVAQWARIKARVAEIDGRAITEHVYINRYVPHYYPNYPYINLPYVYCDAVGSTNTVSAGTSGTITLTSNGAGTFDSHTAMLSLGRAEAQQLNS